MSIRTCLGCGAYIAKGSRCPDCTPRKGSTRAYRATRATILQGNARCYLCGAQATQTDHVVPVIQGGTDHPSNLRPVCWPCNRAKGGGPSNHGPQHPPDTLLSRREEIQRRQFFKPNGSRAPVGGPNGRHANSRTPPQGA